MDKKKKGRDVMTIYQELQLSSAGSKNLIRRSENKEEKKRHIFIYNAKVYLVVAFCFAVVTAFSLLFGSANSIAGVVVLLALLVLRQADFGIRTSHGLICIGLIFGVLIAGPRLSNMLPPGYAFFANCIFIMILMVLGCHNVIMSNHSTFVLSYLLLQGYDVSGADYEKRIVGLLLGMVICMAVFYKNQRLRPYRRSFLDLFREFHFRSARNWWYIRMTLTVSTALLIMNLLGISRAMWAGIACMSVCLPFEKDMVKQAKERGVFNLVGSLIFLGLYLILPADLHSMLGLIGGIGVGYSARYPWQTVFNTFGALSIASGVFGITGAVILRIGLNAAAALYTVAAGWLFDRVFNRLSERIACEKAA